MIFVFLFSSSSDSEEEKPMPKKPLKFKNKKEAMEAFKALLKEKVMIESYHNST